MRWHEQNIEAESESQLPGFADGATVRTFDAPEALNARFHEVRAKSALNRVPGGSKMPFRWTVNPYRGCLHACTFCASGDTQILLADGRTRPLAHIRTGDEIFGTARRGQYRRYLKTVVKDHWSTVKPAYRIRLADGTELVVSGDHRLLAESRGWKYVTGSMGGPDQRPYLTTNNSLVGTGGFASGPDQNIDYQLGYLSGLIRGDGHLKQYWHRRPERGLYRMQSFRLALADTEALHRAERFLAFFTIGVNEREFAAGGDNHRRMQSISTSRRASYELIRQLIRVPMEPSDDWRKGFLAGIFDAEGSSSHGEALRISNKESGILAWTMSALMHFGFDHVLEGPNPARCYVIRLRGGLKERLRFFHLTDPAITRKRNIEGLALKSDADLRVVSIEPLGKAMRLYDITTGTGDFIGNGVVHHNCFARPTHEYLEFDAGKDFDEQIIVKVNAPEVLRAELKRPSWRGEHVALGTNTDPYQWVEKRYGLTRGVLEALRDARNPCSVLTKSPLLLRDLELFKELMEVTEFSTCLSIPTLDEKAWRATEPHTPHPRKRLEAVQALNEAGIPTGVLVAPLMPGINDAPEQVEAVVAACREHGATRIGGQALFLRGATRDVFMGWLRVARPDLVDWYERMYFRRARLPQEQRKRTEARLRELTRKPRRSDMAERFQRGAPAVGVLTFTDEGWQPAAPREPWTAPAKQESLF